MLNFYFCENMLLIIFIGDFFRNDPRQIIGPNLMRQKKSNFWNFLQFEFQCIEQFCFELHRIEESRLYF